MVRKYKRKTEVRWTKEDMEKAITEAKSTKNIKSSANKYTIPYTTLRDHMSGRVSGENSRGHPTVLKLWMLASSLLSGGLVWEERRLKE